MNNIINCTPHTIHIYSIDDCVYESSVRKLILNDVMSCCPHRSIEPSGVILNARDELIEGDPIDGIPTKQVLWIVDPDTVMKIEPDTFYIVSALFVNAMKNSGYDTSNLLTVGGAVYESIANPKPVGCTFLNRN